MAKQIIDEIREAEAQAERVTLAALEQAGQTVSAAQAKAAQLTESSTAAARKKAAAIIATEDNNGFKVRAKAHAENEQAASEFAKGAAGRREAAIDYIIGQIVPK